MGKRFLLVNAPSSEEAYHSFIDFVAVFPPVGILTIAAALERIGYQVQVLDADAERLGMADTVERVVAAAPDFVGLTTMTATMDLCGRLLSQVKSRLPGVRTFAGGTHVSALPERTLREYPAIDYAVVGEGDETIAELMAALEAGRTPDGVPGIAFRRGGQVVLTPARPPIRDLSVVPPPAFHLLKFDLYRSYGWNRWVSGYRAPLGVVFTGRGCFGRCNFCASHCVFGQGIRYFAVERIEAEIDRLVREFGIRILYFQDDTFTANRRVVNAICDFLVRRGYHRRLEIMVSARVDTTHLPTLRRMRQAGIRWICFGVESGNQRILDRMGKNITLDQIRRAFAQAREAGMFVAGNFMIGHLGETPATVLDTVNLACELDQDYTSFAIAIPFPGTGLYEYCLEQGIALPAWGGFGSVNSPPIPLNPGLGAEDLMRLRALAIRRFFGRPRYLLRLLRRFRARAVVTDFARMFLAMRRERKARRF